MQSLGSAITLTISVIFLICMMLVLYKSKSKKRLVKLFSTIFISMLVWDTSLLLQNLFSNKLNINPIYFDYISYVGVMFLPVFLYLTAKAFAKPNFKLQKYHAFLFAVPILSVTVLWTNDFHHLFYTNYSLFLNESTFGAYFYVHTIYTYSLIVISLMILLRYSFKQNNKLSAQSILFLLAIAIPVITNIVGMLNLYQLTIYATPISFTASVLLLFIAIFKFDFLNINTIATKIIVDTISDPYIVIDNENIITTFNKAFLDTFKLTSEKLLRKDIFHSLKDKAFTDDIKISMELIKINNSKITVDKYFENIDKYFSIDFSPIKKNDSYMGTLIFLKDVTEEEKDKQKIKESQELLIEQERLASLGQMIGGIAHNLKTPIFSISGGLEGLSDLVKEYDESIDDDSVTNSDMHEIAGDMKEWLEKLKNHISYMSEVITTVKDQAVTMANSQNILFPVQELFQHVRILMQDELKQKLTTLVINNSSSDDIKIEGNINSLVQVINNLISNAIEAYTDSSENKKVELSAKYDNTTNEVIISVKDYGPGLPETVQEKLFKEMITTKGKDRTGLRIIYVLFKYKSSFQW